VPADHRTDGSRIGTGDPDLPIANPLTVNPTVPMLTPPGSADDLARLKREREDADREYNDALTALDGAIQRLREMPLPPRPYDEFQITPLNERWELLPLKPAEGGGWLGWLRGRVWAMVSPLFERQQAFNSALVDHVNRNVAMHRETTRATADMLSVCREELERLVEFQSKLILWAQQITLYVDTKDRSVAGLSKALAAALSGLSDELQKRWESMVARERRYDAQVNDVRSTQSVMQRAVQALKRERELRGATDGVSVEVPARSPGGSAFDAYKYVAFEDQFRGSQQQIRERMAAYVSEFKGAGDVLEVGCGRGEFLDLLREQGIPARGVDINCEMVALCRDRGLDATEGDALSYLLAQPDGSLGGLFAAQVVEHLEPDYLMRLLDVMYHKLRPGSRVVLETINPACWSAFFDSYIRDFTHVRPLHPDTLRYLLGAGGFQRVEIRYSTPFPDESKLQPIRASTHRAASAEAVAAESLSGMAAVINENVRRLNGLLFTYLDYAVIGERL
jgi:O-antigen chain-terminating methyltransferase